MFVITRIIVISGISKYELQNIHILVFHEIHILCFQTSVKIPYDLTFKITQFLLRHSTLFGRNIKLIVFTTSVATHRHLQAYPHPQIPRQRV